MQDKELFDLAAKIAALLREQANRVEAAAVLSIARSLSFAQTSGQQQSHPIDLSCPSTQQESVQGG